MEEEKEMCVSPLVQLPAFREGDLVHYFEGQGLARLAIGVLVGLEGLLGGMGRLIWCGIACSPGGEVQRVWKDST